MLVASSIGPSSMRALEPLHDEGQHEADDDSADAEVGEAEHSVEDGERLLVHDRHDPELQGEQAGGVVHQALAFDDVRGAACNAEPPGDRRRGDGVARSASARSSAISRCDRRTYAKQFSGKDSHRVLNGIGHNVPQRPRRPLAGSGALAS